MSLRIDDVLDVLAGIRRQYRTNMPEPMRQVRIRVVHEIATRRGVKPQTIADAYIRRLAPDIEGTPAFDSLVEEWLAFGSRSLQLVLENRALDRGDKPHIQDFFR